MQGWENWVASVLATRLAQCTQASWPARWRVLSRGCPRSRSCWSGWIPGSGLHVYWQARLIWRLVPLRCSHLTDGWKTTSLPNSQFASRWLRGIRWPAAPNCIRTIAKTKPSSSLLRVKQKGAPSSLVFSGARPSRSCLCLTQSGCWHWSSPVAVYACGPRL